MTLTSRMDSLVPLVYRNQRKLDQPPPAGGRGRALLPRAARRPRAPADGDLGAAVRRVPGGAGGGGLGAAEAVPRQVRVSVC